MAEKPRFRRRTVFAKKLGFGVGFGYRHNTNFGSTRTPGYLILGVLAKFSGVYYSRTPVNGNPAIIPSIKFQ